MDSCWFRAVCAEVAWCSGGSSAARRTRRPDQSGPEPENPGPLLRQESVANRAAIIGGGRDGARFASVSEMYGVLSDGRSNC